VGGLYESLSLPSLFGMVGLFGVVVGVLMLVFSGRMTKMMHGVR
jgi:hypothetical protein